MRTALGLAVCALLAGRLAIQRDQGWAVGAAIAAAVMAVGVIGWSHDRYHRAARRLDQREPVDFALPALALSVASAVIGLLALLLIAL